MRSETGSETFPRLKKGPVEEVTTGKAISGGVCTCRFAGSFGALVSNLEAPATYVSPPYTRAGKIFSMCGKRWAKDAPFVGIWIGVVGELPGYGQI